MSPMADGPLKYVGSLENENMRLEHVTQFGRSFSVISIPYSFKLMIQELQAINIQIRIITEDNIDQIENMSYSNNIEKVTNGKIKSSESLITSIQKLLQEKIQDRVLTPDENDFTPTSPEYDPNSPAYDPTSPAYNPESPVYNPNSPYNPQTPSGSPQYVPESPPYAPNSPYIPQTPSMSPPYAPTSMENTTDKEAITDSSMDSYIPPPPPIDEEDSQEGGGSRYNVGERVCMRNCKDNYPTRPWKVSHVGPKFLTVSAIDRQGLSDNEATNVVLPFDIYPESQAIAKAYTPTRDYNNMQVPSTQQPVQPVGQPTVVIAPKFFNGNGSDNSMTDAPTSVEPISYDNLNQKPSIVIKDSAAKSSKQAEEAPASAEPDFSNLVIKKVG